MTEPPRYRLVLRLVLEDAAIERTMFARLRQLLKRLGRDWGFRALEIEPVRVDRQKGGQGT